MVKKVKQSVKQNRTRTSRNTIKGRGLRLNCGAGDGVRTRDILLGRIEAG